MVEFVCPICLEGDNGEPTRLHPCGVHRYHLRCLVSHFRDDKRCALCRRTGPATASEPGITPAVTYRHVTASNWECTYCKNNLIQNHSCYEIIHVITYYMFFVLITCWYHINRSSVLSTVWRL